MLGHLFFVADFCQYMGVFWECKWSENWALKNDELVYWDCALAVGWFWGSGKCASAPSPSALDWVEKCTLQKHHPHHQKLAWSQYHKFLSRHQFWTKFWKSISRHKAPFGLMLIQGTEKSCLKPGKTASQQSRQFPLRKPIFVFKYFKFPFFRYFPISFPNNSSEGQFLI